MLWSTNDREEIKSLGDASIKKWFDEQTYGASCVVVRSSAETANRPWVIYEISKVWNDKRAVWGIGIDKPVETDSSLSVAGATPLSRVTIAGTTRSRADLALLVIPIGADSKAVYAFIAKNIEAWIEEANRTRTDNWR